MKYNVHVFAVVRVKVENIEAENHARAMKIAEQEVRDNENLFQRERFVVPGDPTLISYVELAEDEPATCYLVDEQGDDNYDNSIWYNSNREEFKREEANVTTNESCPEPRWGLPQQWAITKAVNDCLQASEARDGDALANALQDLQKAIAPEPDPAEQGMPTRDELIEAAREEYANDDISIDDDALLSYSDGNYATWVQAWVYVRHSEIEGYETCRTEGCDGDPDSGDGWDGYCGDCADKRDSA